MAKNNNYSGRVHVSPGVYTSETELMYASKSLGITTLGVAGETLKGPAFQPILIQNWRQFTDYFGGTSPEKFEGSQYPKYELPYIAKSYLQQSNQLQVVRTLGLSGTNAGPAWVITTSKQSSNTNEAAATATDDAKQGMVTLVLRSRAEYQKVALIGQGECDNEYEYDKIKYLAKNVNIGPITDLSLNPDCGEGTFVSNPDANWQNITPTNYGRFTITVELTDGGEKKYAVSLNPGDKNYIYNVLGGRADDGDAEVYVEELYDIALAQRVMKQEINFIDADVIAYEVYNIVPKFAPVNDLLTEDESTLTRKDVGKRFLYSKEYSVNAKDSTSLKVHVTTDNGVTWNIEDGQVGHIYTVVPFVTKSGKREYYYGEYQSEDKTEIVAPVAELNATKNDSGDIVEEWTTHVDETSRIVNNAVYCLSDNMYYISIDGLSKGENDKPIYNDDTKKYETEIVDVTPVTMDINNYKEQYRCASTPWFVSELRGDGKNIELTKLFRFHTISDGDTANTEVKVSIENVNPDNGTFDVIVRDYNDSDMSVVMLERYKGVNLIPGSQNYIALRIGSTDGHYETMSKYITVEVIENDKTAASVPCGFMGYPIRDYNGTAIGNTPEVEAPVLQYNATYDEDIRINRQYFGMSDLVGIDSDVLKYKGVEAYNGIPAGMTPGFHLDSRISSDVEGQVVTVDGIEGYTFSTVSRANVVYPYNIEPRIGAEQIMVGTIYEDMKFRKFTACFYGGFDGWDYYRKSRTITDDFKQVKYKGYINPASGEGTNFSVLRDAEAYGFDRSEKILNTDWYAYLSAIRQFANPQTIDINVLATPGIDYVNNKLLVEEVIDMVQNERADSVYVVTTPDKPFGAADDEGSMFTPQEAVFNLNDSEIDSNYTCSYYPWVKYFDAENSMYVFLPPTKDIVRNFALTDNTAYPWFAAAGWNRGNIEGVRPRKSLKIGEEDELYDGRLNFIKMFANEGMKLWGDKNLQVMESQMNRISKRRLLLRIRKLCSIACIGLLFDPNDNTTAQAFKSAVTPILDNIMSNRGIVDYRIEVDDSVEARERLELPAKIFIKPTPNLEYIDIQFVITPQGTSWDDI